MRKPVAVGYWVIIAASVLTANAAAQQHWPLWTITIAGAVFLGAVVGYVVQAQQK